MQRAISHVLKSVPLQQSHRNLPREERGVSPAMCNVSLLSSRVKFDTPRKKEEREPNGDASGSEQTIFLSRKEEKEEEDDGNLRGHFTKCSQRHFEPNRRRPLAYWLFPLLPSSVFCLRPFTMGQEIWQRLIVSRQWTATQGLLL